MKEGAGFLWGRVTDGNLVAGAGSNLRANSDVEAEGPFTPTWQGIMIPLFKEIVTQGAIPEREEILSRTKFGVLAREKDQHNVGGQFVGGGGITWGSGDFFPILKGTYGMRHHGEVMPNTGRYYMIPVFAETLGRGRIPVENLVTTDQFDSPEEYGEYAASLYPEKDEVTGSGYVTQVGDTCFAMHSQEYANQDMTDVSPEDIRQENFSIRVGKSYAGTVSGELGMHQFLMLSPVDDTVRIHCVNVRAKATTLKVKAEVDPEVSVEGPAELASARYADGTLTVVLRHDDGSGTVVLSAP